MELRKGKMGIWKCFGRVPGYNPAFIPKESILAVKIVEHYHKSTLHGGEMMKAKGKIFGYLSLDSLQRAYAISALVARNREQSMPSQQISSLPQELNFGSEPFTTGVLNYKAVKR